MRPHTLLPHLALSLIAGFLPLSAQGVPHPDHQEFEALLFAPYRGAGTAEARVFKAAFQFPGAAGSTLASWKLELCTPKGEPLRVWYGETLLVAGRGQRDVAWDGLDLRGRKLPAGFYTLRLTAAPLEERAYRNAPGGHVAARVEARLAQAGEELEVQEQGLKIGELPAPKVRRFPGLPLASARRATPEGVEATVAAPAGLPYTILLGNMHSQTSHSDGGTAVASCGGAETPQGGTVDPSGAFEMMRVQAGGDFLLASEHNHMYDGSTSENQAADPAAAKGLWQSGAAMAASYRSAHPEFMALYGNEWGVISNGGHMNLLNPDGLANWEHTASGALLGHYEVPKSDYAAMYAFMKQRGWVGQFNHPKTSGQFQIGGTPLAYDANGAEVMALCEIMNTSAFSTNTTETETSRSFYTGAWNMLLERGYKVAPTTDQDNHCANYGLSYRNRTGVLIPVGAALTVQTFLDAVKARRVFATMDKTGQLVLTANGHVMGESFPNSGSLTLTAAYASTSGQTPSRVQFFEGVPGRNGTVTQLFEGADTTTFTPAEGEHFYYAVVTQANGDQLWTAPVWVTQGAGAADTAAPTVSASASGTSGTLTLSAAASDNVGVAKVEFFVDGVLKATDSTAPYAATLEATTLTNGSHSLVAKATDAAGNVGTSAAVSFTVANPDITAPTVTASASGTSGLLSFAANASDNVGVTKVEFFVDGVLKATDTTAPYAATLDSTSLANGSHSLVAKATDAAGNVGTSAAVAFTVNNPVADTTAPTVSATASGTSGTISFAATASDNVGVTKVEFFVDGTLKATDTTAPYAATLDSTTLANGSHSLVAKAFDAAGNVGTSGAVAFTVSNPVSTTFLEVESNGTLASANVVPRTATAIQGTMGNTTDKDHFALTVNAGETMKLAMTGPGTTDYDLYLLNAAGTTLTSSTGSTSTEAVTWTNTAASGTTVYAQVLSYSGSSTTTPYVITPTYTAGAMEKLVNGGFESGATGWTASSGVITNDAGQAARGGTYKAWLNGYGSAHTDTLAQTVTLPTTLTSATFSFWLHIDTAETTTTSAYDTLKVQVRNASGTVLATLATYSNLNKNTGYGLKSFDLSAYKGQTLQLYFLGVEGGVNQTSFVVDDASLQVK